MKYLVVFLFLASTLFARVEEFKKGCEANDSVSCANLGAAYIMGKMVDKDYKLGMEYSEKACKMGEARACGLLGIMYFNGEGTPQNLAIAKDYFEKSCKAGLKDGCKYFDNLSKGGH